MAITILAPALATTAYYADSDRSVSDEEDGGVDLDGDIDMRPKKRARHHEFSSIVTPGETVTDDPQWMR
jgi:exosome complex component RRP4